MAHWASSLVLIGFGYLASFSIGQPIFLIGLAMLLLGVFRHRPLVFWPPMLAVIAYDIAYWAVAPLGCTSTITASGVGRAVCSNLLGLPYEGEGIYNPSLRPAMLTALIVAAVAYIVVLGTLYWRRRRVVSSAG